MQPTQILMNEHRVIEQVLNCLETIAARCLSEGKLGPWTCLAKGLRSYGWGPCLTSSDGVNSSP